MTFKKFGHILEHLFYRTPVFQVPKNMQIYCKDRSKSMQMMENIQMQKGYEGQNSKKYTNI